MKYQLVFSRQKNEENNYERGNPNENILLLIEARAPNMRDCWIYEYHKKANIKEKTVAFFLKLNN